MTFYFLNSLNASSNNRNVLQTFQKRIAPANHIAKDSLANRLRIFLVVSIDWLNNQRFQVLFGKVSFSCKVRL